jgi:hypothetical protein
MEAEERQQKEDSVFTEQASWHNELSDNTSCLKVIHPATQRTCRQTEPFITKLGIAPAPSFARGFCSTLAT